MPELPSNVKLLMDIETRQDEVLRELEALEQRIERVLCECAAFCRLPGGQSVPMCAARKGSVAPEGATAPQSPEPAPSIPAVKVA